MPAVRIRRGLPIARSTVAFDIGATAGSTSLTAWALGCSSALPTFRPRSTRTRALVGGGSEQLGEFDAELSSYLAESADRGVALAALDLLNVPR